MFGKISDLFRKKEVELDPIDFGQIRVDMHSHFIPGIDDGAETMEDSIALIRGMYELGYQKVITTPHVMSDYYRNSPETIRKGRDDLRKALESEGISIEVDCAAEYYLDAELMDKVKNKELLTFGDNYVLFELPFISEPANLSSIIFEMQLGGYKPVLAHPERYGFWHMNLDKYQEMTDKGVILQLNINSLTGHYSPAVKKVAANLIDNDLIGFVGSDCHHLNHIELLKQASKLPAMHQVINSGSLLNQTIA